MCAKGGTTKFQRTMIFGNFFYCLFIYLLVFFCQYVYLRMCMCTCVHIVFVNVCV